MHIGPHRKIWTSAMQMFMRRAGMWLTRGRENDAEKKTIENKNPPSSKFFAMSNDLLVIQKGKIGKWLVNRTIWTSCRKTHYAIKPISLNDQITGNPP